MSNSSDSLAETLNIVTTWIFHVCCVLQIIFGTCGNLFNIIIFTRPTLRTNPCSMYFLGGSITNLFEIYTVLLHQYLINAWKWTSTANSIVWCKILNWLVNSVACLALWFLVLSSYDRFLISSRTVEIRRMSNTRLAKKMIAFTTLFFLIIFAPALFFFTIIKSGGTSGCTIQVSTYLIFINFLFVIFGCTLPIIFMVIFGTLTFINVRKSQNRIAPQGNNIRQERLRANDRQLIRMLLSQVLITTLLSVPFCFLNMYYTFTTILPKQQLSISDRTILNFIGNMTRLLYITSCVIGFYVYTLSSSNFNAECRRCIRHGLQRI
ncbi:hypothetical protein I4U23_005229 [Adineta vaga]|nr:hypothetical protein I4U23_005229 [Adineta vaga]